MSKLLPPLILLLTVLSSVRADIPVHCLRHQILGLWDIELTEPAIVDKEQAACGHKSPDDPAESWRSGVDKFNPTIHFQVLLNPDNTAIKINGDQNSTGNWTLIYDEGFDIIFDDHRLTNFFYYFPNETEKNGYSSDCGKTTIGWYKDHKTQSACWRGTKVLAEGESQDDLYGEQTEQRNVVQPDHLLHSASSVSLLEAQSSASGLKKKRNNLRATEEPVAEQKTSKYRKDFTNHTAIVERLNRIEKKAWTAKVYPQFESKSLGELNMMAGRRKATKIYKPVSLIEMETEDVSDLPKEFDWGHMLGELREQKTCGSCYAFATLQMLEARLKIKYNETVTLSVQHAIDCAFYNQGCRGGYPYLLELYANQYELVPESCAPYKSANGKCGTCDVASLDKVYQTENFKFVGGAYGKATQRQMMIELMNNGPIVASFEPSSEFMYYEGGVYHSVDAEWLTNGEERPEWEKVDHSVLLYGWGETEDGLKYWKLRNTWGPDWGENGDFRMKRGVDDSAIESLAEAADPIIVYKNKNHKI